MTWAQQFLLNGFLHSLAGVPWFDRCGEPDSEAVVAGDLVEAWHDWNPEMMAVWSPQTHALEKVAIGTLGDGGVDAIFAAVSRATETPLREGAFRYFGRRPADSEIAQAGVDEGLWPDWVDSAKRDLCWAAVEAVLRRPAFFTALLWYYRAGRWPCAWEGADRSRRVVLL